MLGDDGSNGLASLLVRLKDDEFQGGKEKKRGVGRFSHLHVDVLRLLNGALELDVSVFVVVHVREEAARKLGLRSLFSDRNSPD